MLGVQLMDNTRLRSRPLGQRVIAHTFLRVDYRKIELRVEGLDRLPRTPVIYALNHTDAFNYWPLQYHLLNTRSRMTATWVKGKNFAEPVVSFFMRHTNNIPSPSKGYVITQDFVNAMGRRPSDDEYRAIRDAFDALADTPPGLPRALVGVPRDMLGRPFVPSNESYVEALDALFDRLMRRFIELNEQAIALGLDVLVFPQGSRSRRLSRGHIGIAQMATHLRVPIVPVGCSGGDIIYPTRSPICRPGRVTYRIGEAITPQTIAEYAAPAGVDPFARAETHRGRYQALVDLVMEQMNGLLDEPYQAAPDQLSDGTRGTHRFL